MRISTRIVAGLTLLFIMIGGISVHWVRHNVEQFTTAYQAEAVRKQACILIKALKFKADGEPYFDLPERLRRSYNEVEDGKAYLLVDKDGKYLAESTPIAHERLEEGLKDLRESAMFNSSSEDGITNALYGMVREISADKAGGQPMYLIVGRYHGVEDILLSRASDKITVSMTYLLVPLFVIGLFLTILVIVVSLYPLNLLALQAKKLTPDNMNLRLDETLAPGEVKPFIHAINRLLSRVELNYTERQHFLVDSAHQLRTPLAVMRARIDQLPNFKGKDALEKDIGYISRLIQQLLALAQVEGKHLKLSQENLVTIVRERAESLAPLALKLRTSFTIQTPDEVKVRLNPSAAGEAIFNVLDNAIRFSPKGKPVEIIVTEQGQVQIHDRGPGVDPAKRLNLFKRTWQESGREDGVGLGLAIVGEIMRKHGGSVTVTDREGGGSTFILQFTQD